MLLFLLSLFQEIKNKIMKATYKHIFIVGTTTYIKVKSDLYKVFDCDNNYLGLANGVGYPVFA